MSKSLLCSVALVLMLLPSPVRAASIVLDGSGELTGATGVLVGANLYDVSFVDGTCAALFSGCNDAADFQFTTFANAQSAGQALLDQVFNPTNSTWDNSPALTAGCSAASPCVMYTPYAPTQPGIFAASGANNSNNELADSVIANPTAFGINDDFSAVGRESFVFARWSPAATDGSQNPRAVPEPASLLLLGSGLSAAGFFRRRKAQR